MKKSRSIYIISVIFIEIVRKVGMEIFSWYDIDLKNNNGLYFENLLEKTLVIIGYKKIPMDFI